MSFRNEVTPCELDTFERGKSRQRSRWWWDEEFLWGSWNEMGFEHGKEELGRWMRKAFRGVWNLEM